VSRDLQSLQSRTVLKLCHERVGCRNLREAVAAGMSAQTVSKRMQISQQELQAGVSSIALGSQYGPES
jgi:hypothetical protein